MGADLEGMLMRDKWEHFSTTMWNKSAKLLIIRFVFSHVLDTQQHEVECVHLGAVGKRGSSQILGEIPAGAAEEPLS